MLSADFDVTFSHIFTGTDFFNLDLTGYDAVVSNPPFSKRTEIFERLFESAVPFAMIMNGNGLFDAKKRFELFKANEDFQLLIPKGRMRFYNQKGNIQSTPSFQSIYVCRGVLDKQIEFVEADKDD